MSSWNADDVRKALVACLAEELGDPAVREVAFHLTDWLSELAPFVAFLEAPSSVTKERLGQIVLALVTHAPAHLAAAHKLVVGLPVTDVFEIGAVSERD